MDEDIYVTPPSYLPIVGSCALLLLAVGLGNWLHGSSYALWLVFSGLGILTLMVVRWFAVVIAENQTVLKGDMVLDRSMRWGMVWFIFTEVMFFAAFFGVLFYIRTWVLPQLSGLVESKYMTHALLWPDFSGSWPLATTPDPAMVTPPKMVMGAVGIPLVNTILLLLSGVTITIAHYALGKNNMPATRNWLVATIMLGVLFLCMQVYEYHHAYVHGLTLSSGIYGNIFFMMTGFHGLHVFLGSVILGVIAWRTQCGHFSPTSHFAFEAAAWYWHFVDVVWLTLFVFVYWI